MNKFYSLFSTYIANTFVSVYLSESSKIAIFELTVQKPFNKLSLLLAYFENQLLFSIKHISQQFFPNFCPLINHCSQLFHGDHLRAFRMYRRSTELALFNSTSEAVFTLRVETEIYYWILSGTLNIGNLLSDTSADELGGLFLKRSRIAFLH